jgi:hypothetical protein
MKPGMTPHEITNALLAVYRQYPGMLRPMIVQALTAHAADAERAYETRLTMKFAGQVSTGIDPIAQQERLERERDVFKSAIRACYMQISAVLCWAVADSPDADHSDNLARAVPVLLQKLADVRAENRRESELMACDHPRRWLESHPEGPDTCLCCELSNAQAALIAAKADHAVTHSTCDKFEAALHEEIAKRRAAVAEQDRLRGALEKIATEERSGTRADQLGSLARAALTPAAPVAVACGCVCHNNQICDFSEDPSCALCVERHAPPEPQIARLLPDGSLRMADEPYSTAEVEALKREGKWPPPEPAPRIPSDRERGRWQKMVLDIGFAAERVRNLTDELHDALSVNAPPAAPVAGREPAETRTEPCGCVICVCADEKKCQGCGAKCCPAHARALAADAAHEAWKLAPRSPVPTPPEPVTGERKCPCGAPWSACYDEPTPAPPDPLAAHDCCIPEAIKVQSFIADEQAKHEMRLSALEHDKEPAHEIMTQVLARLAKLEGGSKP